LLIFLSVLLNAEPKLYAALHPRWANPMLGVPRMVWAVLIATFFVAGVVFGQAGPFVLCKGNAVVEEQVVTFAQSPEHLLNVLLLGYLALPAVFSWIRGYDGFVVIHFVVLGCSCCRWWGRWVGRVWQMHCAVWVRVWALVSF
jgi:hypothetical protein